MRLAGVEIDATAWLGGLAFGVASLACVAVAHAGDSRRSSRSSRWWVFATLQLGCLAEVVVGLRHRLHGSVDAVLQAHGWYGSRVPWQVALFGVTAVLAVGGLVVFGRRLRHDPAALGALFGTAFALILFAVETISVHAIDRWMYAPAGPVMMLAWLWTLASTVVTVSALSAWRHPRRAPR